MDTADRQVLWGLLALQNKFIDQDQLVAGLWTWTLDRTRPIADCLMNAGALGADDRAAVEAIVALHGTECADGPKHDLAATTAGRPTRKALHGHARSRAGVDGRRRRHAIHRV